jgi:hypothetical protein
MPCTPGRVELSRFSEKRNCDIATMFSAEEEYVSKPEDTSDVWNGAEGRKKERR